MTTTQSQLTVTDLFGNTFPVTDLDAAITERKMCVKARVEYFTAPFKYEAGIKVMIAERAAEKVPMAAYHDDLLAKLLALKTQPAAEQLEGQA
ncbi:hypothetical protein [Pseudomonas guariconensis]|uniref:hypothetical protein n=1 Tax=Pseudomonas guariconensis TaxID=1288410 RepID=UPI0039059B9C